MRSAGLDGFDWVGTASLGMLHSRGAERGSCSLEAKRNEEVLVLHEQCRNDSHNIVGRRWRGKVDVID